MSEKVSSIEFLDRDQERAVLEILKSFPRNPTVRRQIAKHSKNNRSFSVFAESADLRKYGLKPIVELKFSKVRKQDKTYDLSFFFEPLDRGTSEEFFTEAK